MTTRTSHNVGASNINPAMAGTPAPAKGVRAPPSAGAVPAPGTAIHAAASVQGISASLEVFLTGYSPLAATLMAVLQRPVTGQRVGSVRAQHIQAAPLLAALVRNHPGFGNVGSADVIDTGVADLNASRRLGAALRELAGAVEDTGKLSFDAGWVQASAVLAVASRAARKDKTLDEAITPVRDIMAHGSRAASSARTAAVAQHNAATLAARTGRAQQKATAAATRAATAHPPQRSTRAHGTSPVPLANPQGPAASADVAPQGPAPGR